MILRGLVLWCPPPLARSCLFFFGSSYMCVHYRLPLCLCLSRVCHASAVFRWYMTQASLRSWLTGSGNVVPHPSLLILLYILV